MLNKMQVEISNNFFQQKAFCPKSRLYVCLHSKYLKLEGLVISDTKAFFLTI